MQLKISLFVFVLLSSPIFAGEWKWSDFEVIGTTKVPKDSITAEIPITLGETYQEDPSQWQIWCDALRAKFDFYHVECSSVRFVGFKAFFVVNIVEKGQEYRMAFRDSPTENVEIQDPEIFAWYDSLMTRIWELFEKGTPT